MEWLIIMVDYCSVRYAEDLIFAGVDISKSPGDTGHSPVFLLPTKFDTKRQASGLNQTSNGDVSLKKN